jgi:hypothetical protein
MNNKIDLSTFVLVGNNRMEAYDEFIEYELRFDEDVRNNLSFEEFCEELDKGYENSGCIEIARLYEDGKGRVWYDKEYCG